VRSSATVTVTCQIDALEGTPFVNINYKGYDEAPPDCLGGIYEGVGEYLDPLEAVEAAISIVRRWSEDIGEEVLISYATLDGIPLCPKELDDEVIEAMKKWAKRLYDKLEKCARCGCILDKNEYYTHYSLEPDTKYCSQTCAEMDYFQYVSPEEFDDEYEEDEEDEETSTEETQQTS